MAFRKRTFEERRKDYYQKSAEFLIRANELSERGEKAKAEVLYDKSAYWLVCYGEVEFERD